ncbi:MAG TPA: Ig-like domain-containing protein, partial [Pirellulales bacterium]
IESLVTSGFFTGKDFFRVIDGFVAQNNGSSGMSSIGPETTAEVPFTSPGLLSLANTGQSNGFLGDAQFFITAIDKEGSTTPIPLAEMPQGLQNGSSQQFTVFGQLVSGFDTFEKIMSTTVEANPNFGGEPSMPTQPITITSASLITDTQNAVLKITAPASFDGNTAVIKVTATGSGGATTARTFTASVVVDPPQIAPVANQTTTATTPVTFTLQSGLNAANSGAVYRIFDANTNDTPANVTISYNQSTGQVTITPTPGFKGTLNLLAGVRSSTVSDSFVNYDTQAFTLTVTANPAIKPTLGSIVNQTTAEGAADSFTLTSTDNGANGVVYKVGGDAATFSMPTGATVSVDQSTGKVTITPNPGFVGTINLVAGVRSQTDPDVQASYATQTFTLNVVGLNAVVGQQTAEGAAVSLDLTTTSPGANVVYKIVDGSSFIDPQHVTAMVNSSGHVILTPVAGFTGPITLRAGIRGADAPDTEDSYDFQMFTLDVKAPTLGAVADQTVAVGATVEFDLSTTDPIGHGLVYKIVDVTLGSPMPHYTANIDSSGHVTIIPDPGFSGTRDLLVEVRSSDSPDDEADSATQAFTLNVVAPTLDPISPITTPVGIEASANLSGHNTLGNALVYKSFNTEGDVDVTVDPATGHVTLTPHAGAAGVFNIQVGVRDATSPDDAANYAMQTIELVVGAPSFTIPNQTTKEGGPVEFDFNATDPIGNGLVYKVVDAVTGVAPEHATVVVDQATGHVTVTPDAGFVGTLNLLAEARDVDSPEDPISYVTQAVDVHVVALQPVTDQQTGMGAPITINLSSGSPGAN